MLMITLTGTQVLAGSAALLLALVVLVVVLRRRLRRARRGPADSRTKYAGADVFRYQTPLFQFGLACALGWSVLALNWTTFTEGPVYRLSLEATPDIEQLPPRTPPPPAPPPPPPPPKIEPVPNDEVDEQPPLESQDIFADEPISVPEPPILKPAAAPLPPPPPPVEQREDDKPLIIAEVMPVFGSDCAGLSPGEERRICSDRALMAFLGKHMRYPSLAQENGIQGKVFVRFVIEKDGTVSNVEVMREPGGGLGEEAARVVSLMNEKGPRWRPGRQQGRPVRVWCNLPVAFTLQ